jgi:hypothetical protein
MTPDELYALGYAVETSAWGVRVFRSMQTVVTAPDGTEQFAGEPIEHTMTFHFTHAATHEESARRGWEYAAIDFVQRRLADDAG